MNEKKERTRASATELSEEELGEMQGGYANLEVSHFRGKETDKVESYSYFHAFSQEVTQPRDPG